MSIFKYSASCSPFGMVQLGRSFNSGDYRYGFNGMENDNEVKGNGNSIDFGARVYDPRLGKFLSIDPDYKLYTSWSPYLFSGNSPIRYIVADGRGPEDVVIVFSGAIISGSYQGGPSASTVEISQRAVEFSGAMTHYSSSYYDDPAIVVNDAADIVEGWVNAHEGATVSLVGYSYGGVLAENLAEELNRRGISVDLLYQFDAEDGMRDELDNIVRENVVRNVNVFQRNDDLKGDENFAVDPSATEVDNRNQSDIEVDGEEMDHFNIDDFNVEDAIEEINATQGNDG